MAVRVLDWFVLGVLLSDSLICAAQTWDDFDNLDDTQNQIQQEPARTDLQAPPSPVGNVSNWLETMGLARISRWSREPLGFDEQMRGGVVIERLHPGQNQQKALLFVPTKSEQTAVEQQPPSSRSPSVRSFKWNPPVKSKALEKFEPQAPLPADSVAVHCGEREVTLEVKQNLLGNGQLVNPSDVTLGGCAALETQNDVLLFQAELQECGSTKTMTDEVLVYTFFLSYVPAPIRKTLVVKTNPATVVIECQYPRRQFVSSNAVRPIWKTYSSKKLTEQQLHFSLRLMTDDWQAERSSSVYVLSEMMHIEASVRQTHHIPLRVYIDSCVATSDPDPNSQPSYPFITNYGCLMDSKMTGSKSYFMQRNHENELQLQLKAFMFYQAGDSSLYITCRLKATSVSIPIDSEHKACSFLTEANRWVASGGDNAVCNCCGSSCEGLRRKRSRAVYTDMLQWEGEARLGPILIQQEVLVEELLPEVDLEPASLAQTGTAAATSPSIALMCGVGTVLSLVLLGVMSTVIYRRLHKQSGHAVCT